tara:strand:+ start:6241 stop:7818 length:1578 start_codon:yes stop_codon:yes gene_type:complete
MNFELFKSRYPGLFEKVKAFVDCSRPSGLDIFDQVHIHMHDTLKARYRLKGKINDESMGAHLFKFPYKLLDHKFRCQLDDLSNSSGYYVLSCFVSQALLRDVYENKKWIAHGSHESCIYAIRHKHRAEKFSTVFFIIYGICHTISYLLMEFPESKDLDPSLSPRLDTDFSRISGGLNHHDVVFRCNNIYKQLAKYDYNRNFNLTNTLSLVALKEHNYGHCRWNIFSGYIDIMQYASSSDGKELIKGNPGLCYDHETNYLSINRVAEFYKSNHQTNTQLAEQGPAFLIPLDSPRPRNNELSLLSNAYKVKDPNLVNTNHAIVSIKGFDKSNQNQIELSLSEHIFEEVIQKLLDENFSIAVDGVNRSPTATVNELCNNNSFQGFLDKELNIYKNAISLRSKSIRTKIKPLLGLPVEKKATDYCSAKFTISISAHSTIATSFLFGKKIVDIVDKKILESILKKSILPYSDNVDLKAIAYIEIDVTAPLEAITEKISAKLDELLSDEDQFFSRYSFYARKAATTEGLTL